jgi:hypothetical protein
MGAHRPHINGVSLDIGKRESRAIFGISGAAARLNDHVMLPPEETMQVSALMADYVSGGVRLASLKRHDFQMLMPNELRNRSMFDVKNSRCSLLFVI